MPVAVLAFFFLPDTPGTAKPSWVFTERVSDRSKEDFGTVLSRSSGHRNCSRENDKSRPCARRQEVHGKDHSSILHKLEDLALHTDLHDAAFWITAIHGLCVLAEGSQQEGPATSLYRGTDRMLAHIWKYRTY